MSHWCLVLLALLHSGDRAGPPSVGIQVYQGNEVWGSALALPAATPLNFRWKWNGPGSPESAEWQLMTDARPPAVVNIRLAALAGRRALPEPLPAENQYRRFTLALTDLPLNQRTFYVRVRAVWPGGAMAASDWIRVALRVPYAGAQVLEGIGTIIVDPPDEK